MVRQVEKIVSATATGMALIARVVRLLFGGKGGVGPRAIAVGVATLNMQIEKIVTATAIGVAMIVRAMSLRLAVVANGVALVVRNVALTLLATATGIATLGLARTLSLAATAVGVATVTLQVGKSIAATAIGIADLVIDATVALYRFTGHAGLGMLESGQTRWKARKGWAAKRNTWKPKR